MIDGVEQWFAWVRHFSEWSASWRGGGANRQMTDRLPNGARKHWKTAVFSVPAAVDAVAGNCYTQGF